MNQIRQKLDLSKMVLLLCMNVLIKCVPIAFWYFFCTRVNFADMVMLEQRSEEVTKKIKKHSLDSMNFHSKFQGRIPKYIGLD